VWCVCAWCRLQVCAAVEGYLLSSLHGLLYPWLQRQHAQRDALFAQVGHIVIVMIMNNWASGHACQIAKDALPSEVINQAPA
jgi:hypothetical protein